jgi:SAM-dependent methyltransferase
MSSNTEYNATFADFYDSIAAYLSRADVQFYVDVAREAANAATAGIMPVLELGCGSGRVLIPTAEAGVRIVGLDLSESMLAKCKERMSALPSEVQARIQLRHGSITDFHLGQRFQLITAPFRPFQHLLTVEEQLAGLQCVREHLAPRGRFVFDMFHTNPAAMHDPAWKEEREDTPLTKLPDGRSFRRTARLAAFHRAEQINDVDLNFYITYPDGRTEKQTQLFPFRYFFRYEVEHLLARAGFRIANLYGNFDRSPFADESAEMIFVAEAV